MAHGRWCLAAKRARAGELDPEAWLLRARLKGRSGPTDPRGMPSFVAMLIASLAGWLVECPVRAVLGLPASLAASFVAAAFAYFFARRFLEAARGGS